MALIYLYYVLRFRIVDLIGGTTLFYFRYCVPMSGVNDIFQVKLSRKGVFTCTASSAETTSSFSSNYWGHQSTFQRLIHEAINKIDCRIEWTLGRDFGDLLIYMASQDLQYPIIIACSGRPSPAMTALRLSIWNQILKDMSKPQKNSDGSTV